MDRHLVQLVALALACACGRRDEPSPSAPVSTPTNAPAVAEPPPSPWKPPPPEPPRKVTTIPRSAGELLTARVADWTATKATLRRYRRDDDAWIQVGDAWPAVIGRSGTAWGAGLHGIGAPEGREGPVKREGDGKSPAGAFELRGAYGYAMAAPAGTRISYTSLDEGWQCIEDIQSTHYNQILDRRTVPIDWTSTDRMRRSDALFTWIIDVGHNPQRSPGAGSCIFLHVWGSDSKTTQGCTAMDPGRLEDLVAVMDPTMVYVMLPETEYVALAPAWGLPLEN